MDVVRRIASGIFSAVGVKILSSLDDILWLSKFLSPDIDRSLRLRNAVVYGTVCILQTCIAYAIATGGEKGIDNLIYRVFGDLKISTEKLLTIVSGLFLAVYALILGIAYFREETQGAISVNREESSEDNRKRKGDYELDDQDHENEGINDNDENGWNSAAKSCHIESESLLDFEEHTFSENSAFEKSQHSAVSLFFISFMGSVDDLALFVPLLTGNVFLFSELVVGSMIATIMIVVMCIFLTKNRIISNFLQKIPLFVIVLIFSIFILMKSLIS